MQRLIESIINLFNKDNDYYDYGEEEVEEEPPKVFKGLKKVLQTVFVVILLLVLVFNSYYTLNESEVAIVSTFGKPVSVTTSGIKFKIPFIQSVHKMSKQISGMEIGYDPYGYDQYGGSDPYIPSESEMITKDFNFVNVDFYIEYQIVDPIQAYVNRANGILILKNLAQSYIRDTVGLYNVDEVITTGKSEIQATVKSLLSERLEAENIGLGIYNVTIQDAEPPTTQVNDAFKAVEDAKQGMDTKINEAKQYQSEQVPAANSIADKATRDAEAYMQQRISEAEGQVARFNQMYDEYIKYPLITKQRMFYETIEEVLPSLKVIIDGSDGTQTVLPLDSFTNNGGAN